MVNKHLILVLFVTGNSTDFDKYPENVLLTQPRWRLDVPAENGGRYWTS